MTLVIPLPDKALKETLDQVVQSGYFDRVPSHQNGVCVEEEEEEPAAATTTTATAVASAAVASAAAAAATAAVVESSEAEEQTVDAGQNLLCEHA